MSTRGGGICIVSCLPNREGGLDLSLALGGGYVECQSASVMGTWRGEGGLRVLDHASGEAGRAALPRDEGRDAGGDSRSRVGVWCSGELGLLEGRELWLYAVSTGAGLDFLFSLLIDDDDERGDW